MTDPAFSPMTSPELLPCPWCKGTVQFRKALWISDGNTDAIIHAGPTNCGMVEFSDGTTDESIIAKWNTRAPSTVGVEALIEIARQETSGEIENRHEVDTDECDFMGAYDTLILIARR